MKKGLITMILGVALATAATGATTALAHEDSQKGKHKLVVGFLHEPAYEGLMNAVSIRVTKQAVVSAVESARASAETASHAAASHDAMESEVPLSVSLSADVEPSGNVNLHIATEGWVWQPEDVGADHVPGEGHAHIYVDGERVSRVYAEYHNLSGLAPGERHIRVTLNSNTHADLLYEGEPLDASVMVSVPHSADSVAADDKHEAEFVGVEGLGDTLRVEVTHVPSGVSKTMNLLAVPNDQGHYTAALIPTSPGHYRFRFFGSIEGEPLDSTFDSKSGGGGFDDVQPASAAHFPEELPSVRELESAVRGAQETARQAQARQAQESASANSSALGIIGVALGAAGIVVGSVGVALAARARRSRSAE